MNGLFYKQLKPLLLQIALSVFSSAIERDARAAVKSVAAPAGVIKLVKGQVFIINAQSQVVADPSGKRGRFTNQGAPFYVGETIQTKADGRVKLEFVEGGNEVVLGPNTVLTIETASTQAQIRAGTSLNLARGEVRSNVKVKYSGKDSDLYQVKTPNAVAGVRGTIFMARFDSKTFKSEVATERGAVFVEGKGGAGVLVSAGMFTAVAATSTAQIPKPLASNPELNKAVQKLASASDKNMKDETVSDKNADPNAKGNRGNASVPGAPSESQDAKPSFSAPINREEVKPTEESPANSADKGGAPVSMNAAPAANSGGEANRAPASMPATNEGAVAAPAAQQFMGQNNVDAPKAGVFNYAQTGAGVAGLNPTKMSSAAANPAGLPVNLPVVNKPPVGTAAGGAGGVRFKMKN